MGQKNKYMVRVSCSTYNHAPYIEDAMDGFCMQETTFPFVCTILDDCSTDGEQEVIRKYLHEHFDLEDSSVVRIEETDDYILTFAQHKSNKNCYFAVYFLKYNHNSINKSKKPYIEEWSNTKYVAICEGDDHWNYSLKLKEQVGFLDLNPDFSMCFGDVNYYNADKEYLKGNIGILFRNLNMKIEKYEGRDLFNRILFGNVHIPTLSVLYRTNAILSVPPSSKHFMMGDTPLWLDLSRVGKIKYFDKIYGVYIIHKDSVTHDLSKRLRFNLSKYEMRCYYCDKYHYPIPKQIKKKYNVALKRIVAIEGKVTPSPIYGLFRFNNIQYRVDSFFLKNHMIHIIYKRWFPWLNCISNILTKFRMVLLALCNIILYPFSKQ